MAGYPTPHIKAKPEDFAKTVLMPGDPLRSRFIANTFLEDARLVNNVRGVEGYTSMYKGRRVSVMASGMGIPSMAIYSNELYNVFGVENIIRIGSAGAMQPGLRLRDIVVALGASTDSDYAKTFHLPGTFAPVCSYKLLRLATDLLEKSGASYAVGSLLSSDAFYTFEDELPPEMRSTPAWQRMGILAVDMEAAGLYMNAARAGKNALAICTVSDQLVTDEHLSAADRETGFSEMVTLALDMAAELDGEKD